MQEKIDKVLAEVQAKLDDGRMAEVHLQLSSLYRNPEVPAARVRTVNELLDQMAGMVIYSRQHLLEQPYKVEPGDTLERIAELYNVPPLLLARINGIREADNLRPGRELKVVRGPFSAVIDLGKSELTLMLKERYAGRFHITNSVPSNLEGSYTVSRQAVNTPPEPESRFRRTGQPGRRSLGQVLYRPRQGRVPCQQLSRRPLRRKIHRLQTNRLRHRPKRPRHRRCIQHPVDRLPRDDRGAKSATGSASALGVGGRFSSLRSTTDALAKPVAPGGLDFPFL